MEVIQKTAQIYGPLLEMNKKNQKRHLPWFTKQLKELITYKNELISDFYCHGLKSYKPRIAAISNKITQMKRNLKRKFINEKMNDAKGDSNKC